MHYEFIFPKSKNMLPSLNIQGEKGQKIIAHPLDKIKKIDTVFCYPKI